MTGMSSGPRKAQNPLLVRQFVLAAIVGIGAGLGAVVFHAMLAALTVVIQRSFLGWSAPEVLGEPAFLHVALSDARPWLWVVIPAVGGLLSGLICWRYAPEAMGHGTDAA